MQHAIFYKLNSAPAAGGDVGGSDGGNGMWKKKQALRRVRKEDVSNVRPQQEHDPLDYCLECWSMWLCGDADRDLSSKVMRLPMLGDDPYGRSSDEVQQEREMQIGAAVDAMIDSLSFLHRWAIYATCGVATPWKFPNADLLVEGPAARDALAEKLRRNVCTGVLF